MVRSKVWTDCRIVGFKSEAYLIDALKEDMIADGYSSMTEYLNKIIITLLGEDNNATQKFIAEHPEYGNK